jgi:hypothetical protein
MVHDLLSVQRGKSADVFKAFNIFEIMKAGVSVFVPVVRNMPIGMSDDGFQPAKLDIPKPLFRVPLGGSQLPIPSGDGPAVEKEVGK